MYKSKKNGFTVIELMIALVLGLLLCAAAVQIYIIAITNNQIQKALSSVQDNVGFGINYIISDIRKVNLDTEQPFINDVTPYSGLILTTENIGNKINLNCDDCLSELKNSYVQNNHNSQLMIRFRAPQQGYDCTGKLVIKDTYVVQRYFVGTTSTEPRRSLRCTAAQYTQVQLDQATENNKINLLWSNSTLILPNIDFFKVRFAAVDGALEKPERLMYLTADEYLELSPKIINVDGILTEQRPYIHAMQIGLILKSAEGTTSTSTIKEKNTNTFNVLGQEVKLVEAVQDSHLRQVVNQTITFRNALGWIDEGCDANLASCNQGAKL